MWKTVQDVRSTGAQPVLRGLRSELGMRWAEGKSSSSGSPTRCVPSPPAFTPGAAALDVPEGAQLVSGEPVVGGSWGPFSGSMLGPGFWGIG